MKRISLLLLVMCVAFTVGCAKEENGASDTVKRPDVAEKNQITIEHNFDDTVQDVSMSEEELPESATDSEVEVEDNIYMRYLKGEEKLYFHYYSHPNFDNLIWDAENGYTINELLDNFVNQYMLENRPGVSYSYLDLGDDGNPEMAVRFEGMGIYASQDNSELIYILKEKEGLLELCFMYENWARSDSMLNSAGFYTSGGSTSATSHIIESGFIDAEGIYHFISSIETEADCSQLSYDPTIGTAAQKLAERVGEGEEPFSLITFCFDEIKTIEDSENAVRYRTFEPTGTERDDIYWEVFEEEGLTLYDYAELVQMIEEKQMSIGVTEEDKFASSLEWISWE